MYVFELAALYLLEEVIFVFGSEGVVALEHDIEEYAQGPHVGVDGAVVDFGDNLRGHVCWCAAERVDSLVLRTSQTKPKINQLQLFMPINQYVLRLYIPMHNISTMQIL